jgi:hypothetical protein
MSSRREFITLLGGAAAQGLASPHRRRGLQSQASTPAALSGGGRPSRGAMTSFRHAGG